MRIIMLNVSKKLKKSRRKFLKLVAAHRLGQDQVGAEGYEAADLLAERRRTI